MQNNELTNRNRIRLYCKDERARNFEIQYLPLQQSGYMRQLRCESFVSYPGRSAVLSWFMTTVTERLRDGAVEVSRRDMRFTAGPKPGTLDKDWSFMLQVIKMCRNGE
jgi:hypothetical protein